jgi:hypothetical protein
MVLWSLVLLVNLAALLYGRRARLMARTRKFPHPVSYTCGPFVGMQDSPNPKLADPTLASQMINIAPDYVSGAGVVGRPGFTLLSTTAMATGADGQGVIQHTTKAGVNYTFLVAGGKLYRVTWSAGTLAATLTDVTPVGVTINSSATHVYGVTFDDVIIVSDGVNRPWKMTSLSATPVIGASLTGVPGALYGPPVVYYAKLFGIKADERDTIIWSEEADPDTGYEAGGYDNAWTLGQTDQHPLTCLCATNEALYYFRARSIGRILGAVEDDFVTSGVHDSVSTTDGTVSPAAVIKVERSVYFLDDQGFPHVIRPGGALEDISKPITETVAASALQDVPDMPKAFAAYSHDMGLVLFGHPNVAAGEIRALLAHHAETGQWFGYWYLSGAATDLHAAGVATDADGYQRVVIMDTAGFAYAQTHRRDAQYNDFLSVGGVSTASGVAPSVTGPWMGYSQAVQQVFDRIDLTARSIGVLAPALTVAYQTTKFSASAGSVTMTNNGADLDAHGETGINGHGRGIKVQASLSSTTAMLSLSTITVSGTALSDAPGQG